MKNKRIFIVSGSVIGLLLLFFLLKGSGGSSAVAIIVKVDKGDFIVDVATTGELEAKNSTDIIGPTALRNFRIGSVTIQAIVPEGTLVKKGQFVASLDPTELNTKILDAQLEVDQDEAQFEQTQLDTTLQMREERDKLINLQYDVEQKTLELEQSQFEPPATIKQKEIELSRAKRALEQATQSLQIKKSQNNAKMREVNANRGKSRRELVEMQEVLKSMRIMAPEDGMVIYQKNWDGRPLKEGSQVGSWNPVVAKLPDLTVMSSITYVNEVDIRKVKVGQKVEIGLDAFPEKKLTGKVTKVANVGEQRPNSDAKVFQVGIEVDEVDETIRPGMTTSNTIITNSLKDVLFIPLEALQSYADTISYVYKSDGLNYTRQEVKIGETNTNYAQIELGLEGSDRVYLSIPTVEATELEDISLIEEMNGKRTLEEGKSS